MAPGGAGFGGYSEKQKGVKVDVLTLKKKRIAIAACPLPHAVLRRTLCETHSLVVGTGYTL